jgi:hypothetical protein
MRRDRLDGNTRFYDAEILIPRCEESSLPLPSSAGRVPAAAAAAGAGGDESSGQKAFKDRMRRLAGLERQINGNFDKTVRDVATKLSEQMKEKRTKKPRCRPVENYSYKNLRHCNCVSNLAPCCTYVMDTQIHLFCKPNYMASNLLLKCNYTGFFRAPSSRMTIYNKAIPKN